MPEGDRRLAAIMFTDMVGYTALGQRNETLALALVKEQRRLVRPVLSRHGGREVKTIGDAFLVEFQSALDAARCAYDIQRTTREFNLSRSAEQRIHLRVGLHLGDVVGSQDDISGDAVNVASRVEPLADDGGVCLTRQVYDQVKGKVDLDLSSLGPRSLKNVTEPVEVYRMVMPWQKEIAGPQPQPQARRIAVLPFANMSPDPNDEYFADGMTEELISTMSKIEQVEVISRTSVMQFKKNPKPIKEVSKELDAGTVLEGSVRKAGDKLRVTVQMIDATRDRHVWAESYDRDLHDIFAIQTDIAKQVSEALRLRILPEQKEKMKAGSTSDTSAYVMYLKGRYFWNERTKESLQKAIEYYTEATKSDPKYAKAYAGLAQCYMILENWGYISPDEATPKRRMYAHKAMELDSSLAEAHASMAEILGSKEWDFAGAEREYKKAIEIDPNYALAHHFYGNGLLGPQGRHEEAIFQMKEAKRLDPLAPMTTANLGDRLAAAGRYEEAREQYRSLLDAAPNISSYARSALAYILLKGSKFDEAISELKKVAVDRPIEGTSSLIYANNLAGWKEEAERLLTEFLQKAKETYVTTVDMAFAYASAGKKEEAMEFLEKAAQERSNRLWINLEAPEFDILRTDPRFQKLLSILGRKPDRPVENQYGE